MILTCNNESDRKHTLQTTPHPWNVIEHFQMNVVSLALNLISHNCD